MLAKLYGSVLHGVEAFLVTVEVSVTKGIGYQITGLADESVKESLSRIAIALQHNGFQMPRTKLLIHLGPANMRKSGSALDVAIALGILAATGQIENAEKLNDYLFAGELSLDGTIKPVSGALCRSELSVRKQFKGIILPTANDPEGRLIPNARVLGSGSLTDIIAFLKTDTEIKSVNISRLLTTQT